MIIIGPMVKCKFYSVVKSKQYNRFSCGLAKHFPQKTAGYPELSGAGPLGLNNGGINDTNIKHTALP